jgi:outer membrane protein TolC
MGRIGVTWPGAPWARRGIAAHIAQGEAAVTAAHAQRAVAENAIRLAVEDAYVRAKGAQQRAALLRTTILPQSQQTLDVSRIAYQTDRVEFLALLDNERLLLDARLSYYRALAEQDQALADLERAVGAELAPTALRPVALGEVK